jgi:hypothetical protein
VLASDEYRVLKWKFSSTVTLKELCSIACVIALQARIKPPLREVKRSKVLIIKWFIENWDKVAVWLPFVALLDVEEHVIDVQRELAEKGLLPY